eukprot:7845400-Karenia_brevis.AAC.1
MESHSMMGKKIALVQNVHVEAAEAKNVQIQQEMNNAATFFLEAEYEVKLLEDNLQRPSPSQSSGS